MIIVPAEKQFTWRYAPITLCCLVLVNLFLYFGYQSKDMQKLSSAIESYQEKDFLEVEWPLFKTYLTERKQQKLLEQVGDSYANERLEQVVAVILLQSDFAQFAEPELAKEMTVEDFSDWKISREQIAKKAQSISSQTMGLKSSDARWSTFITHQFMHGSLDHLLGNMFFLVLCGFAVEASIGHWRFLFFYIASGIGGGIVQVLTHAGDTTPLIGASGAISGVMAMYLAIYRFRKIEFFYWFYFLVGYFRAPALLILPFYIGKEIFSYIHSQGSQVAFMAHAGGFISGAILIGASYMLSPQIFNQTYLNTDETIDPKQEILAEIFDAIKRLSFERALKLTDAYLDRFSLDFNIAQIRYNLLRLQRGPVFEEAALKLLVMPVQKTSDLHKLELIWLRTPEIHAALDGNQLIKLAERLCKLESPDTSAQIFSLLREKYPQVVGVRALAETIGRRYQQLGNSAKQQHFSSLAQSLPMNG